jgi:hypothetical protein
MDDPLEGFQVYYVFDISVITVEVEESGKRIINNK